MIWYSLTKKHRIPKTKMLKKNCYPPPSHLPHPPLKQTLPPKCSLPLSTSKNNHSPQAVLFKKFVSLGRIGGAHYIRKNLLMHVSLCLKNVQYKTYFLFSIKYKVFMINCISVLHLNNLWLENIPSPFL